MPDPAGFIQQSAEQVAGQLADKASAVIGEATSVLNTATSALDAAGGMATPPFVGEGVVGTPTSLMKAALAAAGTAAGGATAQALNLLGEMPADAQDIMDAISGGADNAGDGSGGTD